MECLHCTNGLQKKGLRETARLNGGWSVYVFEREGEREEARTGIFFFLRYMPAIK